MGKIRNTLVLALALFLGAMAGTAISGNNVANAAAEAVPDETAAELLLAAVPKGAVVSFNRHVCPTGWSAFTQAEGRAVVGRNPGGTLRGTVGVKLNDKEVRKHNHRVDPAADFTGTSGNHAHNWLRYNNGDFSPASGVDFMAWGDGIDNAGSGIYPVAVDFKGSPNSTQFFNTSADGVHSHQYDPEEATSTATWHRFPYIQLLMCVKN